MLPKIWLWPKLREKGYLAKLESRQVGATSAVFTKPGPEPVFGGQVRAIELIVRSYLS
jgi:hypothetical protein